LGIKSASLPPVLPHATIPNPSLKLWISGF
jgi:hypothetical protein